MLDEEFLQQTLDTAHQQLEKGKKMLEQPSADPGPFPCVVTIVGFALAFLIVSLALAVWVNWIV